MLNPDRWRFCTHQPQKSRGAGRTSSSWWGGGLILTCVGADVALEQPGPGEGFAAEAALAGQGVGSDVHLQGAQAGVCPGAVPAAEASPVQPPMQGQVEGLDVLQGGARAVGARRDGGSLGIRGQQEGEAGEKAAAVLQAGRSRGHGGLAVARGEQPPAVTQAVELCGNGETVKG